MNNLEIDSQSINLIDGISCSLCDSFISQLIILNHKHFQLKSISQSCTYSTIFNEFIKYFIQNLEQSQFMYEKQRKQKEQYEKHIIRLNSQLDLLQQQNQHLKNKILSDNDNQNISMQMNKSTIEGFYNLKQQYQIAIQNNQILIHQLQQERKRVKQIQQGLDQYEKQLNSRENQLKKKVKQLQHQLIIQKDIQIVLKSQLEEEIIQNKKIKELLTRSQNQFQQLKQKIIVYKQHDIDKEQQFYHKQRILTSEIQSLKCEIQSLKSQHREIQTLYKQKIVELGDIRVRLNSTQSFLNEKQQQISGLIKQIQLVKCPKYINYQQTNEIEKFKIVLKQQKQNNIILKKNIFQWESKYITLSDQYKCLKQQIKVYEMQTEQNLHKQLQENHVGKQKQEKYNQKQQKQMYLDENEGLRQKFKKIEYQIQMLQQSNCQKQIKIAGYCRQNQILQQKIQKLQSSCLKIKKTMNDQKTKFLQIISKNQQIYQELLTKSKTNEMIFNENIKKQKQEIIYLQNILKKYCRNGINSTEQKLSAQLN